MAAQNNRRATAAGTSCHRWGEFSVRILCLRAVWRQRANADRTAIPDREDQEQSVRCDDPKSICPYTLLAIAAGWFLTALFVGETELLWILPGPAAQIILVGLTAAMLVVLRTCSSLRGWVKQIDLRWLIALHLTRFVGLYFLLLCARGELPRTFALPAGWGDILVATGAALLMLFWNGGRNRRMVLIWNSIGLVDILGVVLAAARLAFADRQSMQALTRLPLSFLPTLVVPLIIVTHIVIYMRLRNTVPPEVTSPEAASGLSKVLAISEE